MSDSEQKSTNNFEGPEKILEVDFVPGIGPANGLKFLERSTWDSILDLARAQILSVRSNEFFDAYVLSESSLFVYKYKVFLKTCGTTTLLRCLPLLLQEAEKAGLQMEWIGYSRKDFMFPGDQVYPHCSFEQEVSYTKACHGPHGQQLMGGAYLLGDMTADHWYVYVADYCERSCKSSLDRNVNIMMYDLDPSVRRIFYRNANLALDEDTVRARVESGIDKLIPEAEIDDTMFEPCGYSMNALEGEAFHTIHITPEDECCYASYETNIHCKSYDKLLQDVLGVFKPKRFTVTLFADAAALDTISVEPASTEEVLTGCTDHAVVYKRVAHSNTSFKTDYVCQMSNFVRSPVDGKRVAMASVVEAPIEKPLVDRTAAAKKDVDPVFCAVSKPCA
mmetsp:Transcript_13421/g.15298  ORF Transcript_13421/g.15298 Transcript_13421/m.15298 type:complete len:392 (+) Transcript_13421:183-1358(+)